MKRHNIARIVGPTSHDGANMDDAGDSDVMADEHNLDDWKGTAWFVFGNSERYSREWREHQSPVGDEHHVGAQTTDVDSDRDREVI